MNTSEKSNSIRFTNIIIAVIIAVFILGFGAHTMPKENKRQDACRDSADGAELKKANAIQDGIDGNISKQNNKAQL